MTDPPEPPEEQHKGKRGGVFSKLDKEDFQGILALLTLVGAFGLQAAILVMGVTSSEVPPVPAWVTGTVMAIVGFWFGQSTSGGDKK